MGNKSDINSGRESIFESLHDLELKKIINETRKKNLESKEQWFIYFSDFMEVSKILSKQLNEVNKYKLFIPTLYNLRHSIELGLKFLSVYLGEIEKGHNISEHFNKLKKRLVLNNVFKVETIAGMLKRSEEDIDKLIKELTDNDLSALVNKYYYQIPFLKSASKDSLIIEDTMNEMFRYPEATKVRVSINHKFIKNIDERDIKMLKQDIERLDLIFNIFWVLINPDKLRLTNKKKALK